MRVHIEGKCESEKSKVNSVEWHKTEKTVYNRINPVLIKFSLKYTPS